MTGMSRQDNIPQAPARASTATRGPLHRAIVEIRRLRGESVALRGQLSDLGHLLAAYLKADDSPTIALDLARKWAREAYQRGRADGVEEGRLEVVAELKTTDREVKAAFELEIKRWGPGGRAHFGDRRPGDFCGIARTGEES